MNNDNDLIRRGDARGLDTPPSESDHIATMISDLSHTGDLSMLYRMEIADALTSLSAALGSIARNTCCDGCREAALVARAALEPSAPTLADEQMVQYAYDALADRRMDQPTPTLEDALELPEIKALVAAGNVMANALKGSYIVIGSARNWDNALAALKGGAE